jgi:hypothetical protein
VPLPARGIIASGKLFEGPKGYVFTISDKSPVGGWSMSKNRLDAAMGNPPAWRLHDLRRTFVTGLADPGIRPDVIELAGNHRGDCAAASPASTIKVSCCPSGERASERWAAHVEGLVAGKATKVVPMHVVQK